jgi:two-component system phosphate regulon sensor histidine kinase PhoR
MLVGAASLVVMLAGLALVERADAVRAREREIRLLKQGVEAMRPRAAALFAMDSVEADAEIRQWAAASGCRVSLIAHDGRVHADSWTLPGFLGRLENHGQRPEVVTARSGGLGVATRRSVTTARTMTYAAAQVGAPGQPGGFLRFAREHEYHPVPWRGAAVALLAAAVAGFVARQWETRQHRAVARHLAGWAELPSGAELAALAEEADRRFRAQREELEREAEVARAALAEVGEGVVLIDSDGVVRFANPMAVRLLGRELLAGRPLVEAARSPELLAAVRETLSRREATHTSAPGADGAELAVRVCPLPHPVLAAAIVMRDLRGERRLERARRALVADLAHELRTPLTVLGALAEELKEEISSDLTATLERQVRRLQAFAEELEELAAIESGQVKLHRERVDGLEAARQVVKDAAANAAKAGVSLTVDGTSAEFDTDPVRLGQVLGNLVDNAIRYNRPGGSVTVSIAAVEGRVRFRVEDTGLGIPEADIDLVFQRFYRVRRGAIAEGGSGLGLAIVKHLVHALGGTVQLASQEGMGTQVTVSFPASATES